MLKTGEILKVTAATATDTLPKPSVYRPPGSTGFLSEMLKRDGGISGKVSNKGNNNKNLFKRKNIRKPPLGFEYICLD